MIRSRFCATILACAFVFTPAAFAQQGGGSQMNGMQGHSMGGMDMQTMMNQCAQMRRQMQSGGHMTADMQPMMRQCDEMDQQMGNMSGNSSAPRTRTR